MITPVKYPGKKQIALITFKSLLTNTTIFPLEKFKNNNIKHQFQSIMLKMLPNY